MSTSTPSMTRAEKKQRNRMIDKWNSVRSKKEKLVKGARKLIVILENDSISDSKYERFLEKYNSMRKKIFQLQDKAEKLGAKIDRFDSKRRRKLVKKLRKSKTPTRSRSSSRRRRRKKRSSSRARRLTSRLFS